MATEEPPATQTQTESHRKYDWAFLFHYDTDDPKPFRCIPLQKFEGTDFPNEVIKGHMSLSDRLRPRELSALQGERHCIFAKIEKGRVFFNSFYYYFNHSK